jgi:ankyrin repeat protein
MKTSCWKAKGPLSLFLGVFFATVIGVCNITEAALANIKAEDFFAGQQLAAYRAAQLGDTGYLSWAAGEGLDLNSPGAEEMTLLGFAVINADSQAVVTLMRAGADPNQVIPDAGSPALLAIVKDIYPPGSWSLNREALRALLDGGYDPNQMLSTGEPYLFVFVHYNDWQGLGLALERGGDINVKRKDGKSLLTYLIEEGDYAQAGELIAAGAEVAADEADEDTCSALRAIEEHIVKAEPAQGKLWSQKVAVRDLILSKLSYLDD